jgi:two-component system chemotaxis response regulator CheB
VYVLCKPDLASSASDIARPLVRAIRAASKARISTMRTAPQKAENESKPDFQFETTPAVVAMGASTGGTQALEFILKNLPPDFPGTVIVQHMPAYFTATFARRLNDLCRIRVKEAADEDRIVSGQVLIAPGGRHMVVERTGAFHQVRIKDGPMVHHQKPSVDVLFYSMAEQAGCDAVGVLLTMLEMRKRGMFTIAQDEETSLVYGMPAEAVKLGAVEKVLGLPAIPQEIIDRLSKKGERKVNAVHDPRPVGGGDRSKDAVSRTV